MNKREEEVYNLCLKNGLDPFPIIFEVIDQTTMNNICSYSLPTRARHWSYGRIYDYQKIYGEMGYSKVYEVILNNNPSYAFMMDTNSEIQNLFITAHVIGHSHIFKNNYLFSNTDKNMITHAGEHAGRIDEYIDKYGLEKVERIMDIAFALDDHIDWHKGLYRNKYNKKEFIKKNDIIYEFDDILKRNKKIEKTNVITNKKFPPHQEKDLLWFLSNYAPLEDWERDILDIIREEAYYFYPQKNCKILHEGFSSYWHAEIMYQYDNLSSSEYLDFTRDHERVVQSGTNPFKINPYFLGYKIFKDIEKRWDKEYGKGEGKKKIFQVAKDENDISFIRNYLTADLVKDLKLFTFGYLDEDDFNDVRYVEIKSRIKDDVVESLVKSLYNLGAPKIVISEVGKEGSLILKHLYEKSTGTLDFKFAEKTIEYIWELWAAPVELHTIDNNNKVILYFDEGGIYKYIEE